MNMIPLSALAAILIVTGFKLTHPKLFKQLYQKVGDSFYHSLLPWLQSC